MAEPVTALVREAARALTGSERRRFLARTVEERGPGGQRRAERELGRGRVTIRKGQRELASGFACVDGFALRGRKRAEARLPNLLTDLEAIVTSQSQAAPSFRTTRLSTRLTAGEVRRRLLAARGEAARAGLLSPDGGHAAAPKKLPETAAIFEQVSRVNRAADAAGDVLRISLDARATVKLGPFSRRGRSRVPVTAADHDCQPAGTVTPVGLLLPALDERSLYAVTSRATSDCLVDRLAPWWEAVRDRFARITTLVRNLDNGPEHHSHRPQFVARPAQFAADYGVTVRPASYPPYHSKYHPVERCRGLLEQRWTGALLDALATVLQCAATMTWKGMRPRVALVTTTYERGVTLPKQAMVAPEARLIRHPALGKWFIDILPAPTPRDS
jgi:hypothetical protein